MVLSHDRAVWIVAVAVLILGVRPMTMTVAVVVAGACAGIGFVSRTETRLGSWQVPWTPLRWLCYC